MLTGYCGRGDCTGYCPDCYEEGEDDMEGEFESCDVGHEWIGYLSGRCPLCEANIKIETLSDTLEVAVDQLEEIVRLTEPGEVVA